MTTPWALVALLFATPLARVAPAQAIPASQHGPVAQRVGSTDIAITYNRPVARGRPYPGGTLDALRFTVAPEQGAHIEVLAFYFPIVAPDSTVLRLHWGTTIVPFTIRTE